MHYSSLDVFFDLVTRSRSVKRIFTNQRLICRFWILIVHALTCESSFCQHIVKLKTADLYSHSMTQWIGFQDYEANTWLMLDSRCATYPVQLFLWMISCSFFKNIFFHLSLSTLSVYVSLHDLIFFYLHHFIHYHPNLTHSRMTFRESSKR